MKKTVTTPAIKTESVIQITTLHDGTTIKRKVKTNTAMQELAKQAQISDIQEKMKTATTEEKSRLQQRLNNLK